MPIVYHASIEGSKKDRYPPVDAYFVVEDQQVNNREIYNTLNEMREQGYNSNEIAEELGLSAGYVRVMWNEKNIDRIKTQSTRESWVKMIYEKTNKEPEGLSDFVNKIDNIPVRHNTLGNITKDKFDVKTFTASDENYTSSVVEVKYYKSKSQSKAKHYKHEWRQATLNFKDGEEI